MKKVIIMFSALCLLFAACGKKDDSEFNKSKEITVVSREAGSGTRSAFVELTGVMKDKKDRTAASAEIAGSTSIMMTSITQNPYAIGYTSLGVVNDTVKTLKVNGVEATEANIKNGSYKVARPFNIATKGEVNAQTKDFISFIFSDEGQAIVTDNKYIAVDTTGKFDSTNPEGKIVIAGSSSVTPVMQKLKEAYLRLNTNVTIDIQESDSSAGINAVTEGIADIGMVSRELKESELSAGLTPSAIAIDGIAVIVNKQNPLDSLTTDQIAAVYAGEKTAWSDLFD